MTLFLNGFCRDARSFGIPELPHVRVVSSGVVALASEIENPKALADPARAGEILVAHDRLLSSYATYTDVLPARPGSVFASEQALAAATAERAEQIRASLDAISGFREYRLTLGRQSHDSTAPDPYGSRPAPATGQSYLVARAGRRDHRVAISDRQRDLIHSLRQTLADHLLPNRVKYQRVEEPCLFAAVFLAMDGDAAALRRNLGALTAVAGSCNTHLTLIGPCPPYQMADQCRTLTAVS